MPSPGRRRITRRFPTSLVIDKGAHDSRTRKGESRAPGSEELFCFGLRDTEARRACFLAAECSPERAAQVVLLWYRLSACCNWKVGSFRQQASCKLGNARREPVSLVRHLLHCCLPFSYSSSTPWLQMRMRLWASGRRQRAFRASPTHSSRNTCRAEMPWYSKRRSSEVVSGPVHTFLHSSQLSNAA
jgi:hypothetical protein